MLLLAALLTACGAKETVETPAAQEPETAVSMAETEEATEPELLTAEAPDEETAEKCCADQDKAAKRRETAKERRKALLQARQAGEYVLCDTCGACLLNTPINRNGVRDACFEKNCGPVQELRKNTFFQHRIGERVLLGAFCPSQRPLVSCHSGHPA